MSVARVPHAEIFYEQAGGSGDPAVLVHGLWTDRRGWDAVLPGLAGGLDVLAYDRRGHGRSSGEPGHRPVRDDADDLIALLEAIDFHPVHLIAHDYGGAVAFRVATERPELVRSIAVHEVVGYGPRGDDPTDRAGEDRLLRSIRELGEEPPTGDAVSRISRLLGLLSAGENEWEQLAPVARSILLESAGNWLREFDDPEFATPNAEPLGDIEIPVLVTWGERSAPFLQRTGEQIANLLRNSTRLRLPEVGHFPQLSHPHLVVGVLGAFLLERNVPST